MEWMGEDREVVGSRWWWGGEGFEGRGRMSTRYNTWDGRRKGERGIGRDLISETRLSSDMTIQILLKL